MYAQRHGIDAANRKFALYEEGINASYPMERVEIDEWKVDLISIFAKQGLLDHLSATELDQLPRGRRWLHPGEIIKDVFVIPLALDGTILAQDLGMLLADFWEILDGQRAP